LSARRYARIPALSFIRRRDRAAISRHPRR
jgi:hypothetical protein